MFITTFKIAHHLFLSWARWFQSIPPQIHLNIILPSMPASPKWPFSLRFSHQNSVHTSPLLHICYMSHPSHSHLLTQMIFGEECISQLDVTYKNYHYKVSISVNKTECIWVHPHKVLFTLDSFHNFTAFISCRTCNVVVLLRYNRIEIWLFQAHPKV